jgi:hypothetical protein
VTLRSSFTDHSTIRLGNENLVRQISRGLEKLLFIPQLLLQSNTSIEYFLPGLDMNSTLKGFHLLENPHWLEPGPFPFEKNYDYFGWAAWANSHFNWVIMSCVLYVILVFWGQEKMRSRPAFELKGPLLAWNLFLAIGSFLAFSRMFPELRHELEEHGLGKALCDGSVHAKTTAFWMNIFAWSKIIEFGDTAFVVLRKQRLIFLHW